MTPEEFRALIPDYLLGLLNPAQSAALEAACRVDADLAAELAYYQAILGELGSVVPQIEPPADLEARLLARATASRKLRLPRYALGLAAAFLIALIGLGFLFTNRSDESIQEILEAPNSQTRAISGTDLQPDLRGRFTWNDDLQRGVLELENLATLGEQETYQVWFVEAENQAISATLFQAPPTAPLLLELPQERQIQFVGMTVEPAAGSPAPTTPPVFLLSLRDE